MSAKQRKRLPLPQNTHEDGPFIPAQLLGELRETKKRYDAALAAVTEHNARAQLVQREATNAEAVHRHFIERVTKKFKLVDGDVLDLSRGVVRKQLQPKDGVE